MSLIVGIIGLPNVGKSTLFNLLTQANARIGNFPFTTIEPNEGLVSVFDQRLANLAKLINPLKTTYAIIKFIDIAGLVKNAANGEGLGNQFLDNIRHVDVICHVLRCFNDNKVVHVNNRINPWKDCEIVDYELILADLMIVQQRIEKIKNKKSDKKLALELSVCQKIVQILEQGQFVYNLKLNPDEVKIIKSYGLITLKPVFYVANVDDINMSNNANYQFLKNKLTNQDLLPLAIKLEYDLNQLAADERDEYKRFFGLQESGINQLVRLAYKKLGLLSFFTFGKKEVRAWKFVAGMNALECSGLIHSDLAKGFIKAEIIEYKDLMHYKSEAEVKKNGKVKLVGRDYLLRDGNICHFHFNI